MLDFEVAQSTVSKYMARPSKLPSQPWKTFLRNHAEAIASIDMCIVPTLTFDLLFVFLVPTLRRPKGWSDVWPRRLGLLRNGAVKDDVPSALPPQSNIAP